MIGFGLNNFGQCGAFKSNICQTYSLRSAFSLLSLLSAFEFRVPLLRERQHRDTMLRANGYCSACREG